MLGKYAAEKFTQYFLDLFHDAMKKIPVSEAVFQKPPTSETSPLKLLVRVALATPTDNISYKEFVESTTESHKVHPILRLAGNQRNF